MFCTNCGSNISEGAAFCTSCGQATNGAPPQSSPPPAKKTKKKALVVLGILAAVVVAVIATVVIIDYIRAMNMPLWEGYSSFEDFAGAAELNDNLPVVNLSEKGFYALMGSAFAGHLLEPIINVLFAPMGINITVTADFDLIDGPKLSTKYRVPPELRKNYNYLVRRTGIEGSKTYLAIHFDSEKVFGVSIPFSKWIVMVYEEGALIKY